MDLSLVRVLPWLLGMWSTQMCGNEDEPASPPPKALSPSPSEPTASGPYAALPAFIDGEKRCAPASAATSVPERKPVPPLFAVPLRLLPLPFPPLPQLMLLAASAAHTEKDPRPPSDEVHPGLCPPGANWCGLLGPSKVERENAALRARLRALTREHEDKTEALQERLTHTRRSALATLRRHKAEITRLENSLQGGGIYLTNDDSMSLASPQRVIWAIDQNRAIAPSEIRPHELLNYFTFQTLPVAAGATFSVLPELAEHPDFEGEITLALSIQGRASNRDTRANANLAYVIDRSGSMARPGQMELLKRGLRRSVSELKDGDLVHLVLFASTTCPLAQNFVVGRDPTSRLLELIESIEPRGGTNLYDGLAQGYAAVNRSYQQSYNNRVLLLSDAGVTEGVESESASGLTAGNFDARRIRLSAIGFGEKVDDALLDRLTEQGRGASLFLSASHEVDLAFGHRFTSLIENIATDVHFRLQLPHSLELTAFYGEEASKEKQRVQAVHYSSNTAQMYLANLHPVARRLSARDPLGLIIEYDDPKTGVAKSAHFDWPLGELGVDESGHAPKKARHNLTKAKMVASFGRLLRKMAERYHHVSTAREPLVPRPNLPRREYTEARSDALGACKRVQGRMDAFAAELGGEREARRIARLWDIYCARYNDESQELPTLPQARLAKHSEALIDSDGIPLTESQSRQAKRPLVNDYVPEIALR